MTKKTFKQAFISDNARRLRHPENIHEFSRITNGCGPSGWKFDIVPDTIYLLSIHDECNNHDIDWHFAKTWDDALNANHLFNLAVQFKITHHAKLLRPFRRLRFRWYMLAVNGKKGVAHFQGLKKHDY